MTRKWIILIVTLTLLWPAAIAMAQSPDCSSSTDYEALIAESTDDTEIVDLASCLIKLDPGSVVGYVERGKAYYYLEQDDLALWTFMWPWP